MTDTPTPTQTPVATESPFEYVLRNDEITYTSNFANDEGCDWTGIAGVIFDQQGRHQLAVNVRVTGPDDFNQTVVSGSKTEYGQSGWEVVIGDEPVSETYTVRLETSTGDPLSEAITVQTVPNCDSNLALLVFDQVQ